MANKVMSLHDAVEKYVCDNDVLCLGGFTTNRKPYAAVYEILRQGKTGFVGWSGPAGGDWDLALVMKCKEAGTPIICSMGAGNKMDPTRFEVTDIYKTSVCPLAKVMRTECRKRKIKHLKVVYSKEPAMTPIEDDSISCKNHCICPPGTQRKCTARRTVPGSNAFVPSVAGLIIGGEVVKDLVGFVPLKG